MTCMTCARCNRPMQLQASTPVLSCKDGRTLAWGPRCAVLAGVIKTKRRPTKPPTASRAREFAGQLDWIETTEEGKEA